jgi:hypothetical protein
VRAGRFIAAMLLVPAGALVLELVARTGSPASSSATSGAGTIILCIGDSHTRGLPDPDNYPRQLERFLNERTTGRYRLINLGVPGMNTAQVRRRFDRYLTYYRPAIVLHWAGLNNWGNHAERPPGAWQRVGDLAARSRALALLRVTVRGRGAEGAPPEPTIAGHDWPGPKARVHVDFAGVEEDIYPALGTPLAFEELEAVTRDDLAAMLRTASAHGTPMYLIAYPRLSRAHAAVNRAIVAVSAEFGVPYADGAAAVPAARAAAPGAGLFDGLLHPTAPVYRQVAEAVYRLLVARGQVQPRI